MADSSLDDFFAKKDKSKKSKKKSSTPEEMAKKQEDPGLRADKSKKEKEKSAIGSTGVNINILEQDEDEWKDFEDEKAKDYSGLRIQTLSIKDREEEMREQKLQENGQDNKRDDQSGPWRGKGPASMTATATPEPEVVPLPPAPVKDPAPAGDAGEKYVPPGMRGMGAGGAAGSGGSGPGMAPSRLGGGKRRGGAPVIDDKYEFPTLGGAPKDSSDCSQEFTDVKHGSRDGPSGASAGASLTLGNKFNLLNSTSNQSEDTSD